MGRPFGTERSPFRSFGGHVDRQLETGNPVERLDGSREPGGSRRAKRAQNQGARRSRRGPRPEEVRAERQEQVRETRRDRESGARGARNERAKRLEGGSNRPASGGDSAGAPDFGARLRQRAGGSAERAAEPASRAPGEAPIKNVNDPQPSRAQGDSLASATEAQGAPQITQLATWKASPPPGSGAVPPTQATQGLGRPAAALAPVTPASLEAGQGLESEPSADGDAPETVAPRSADVEAYERASSVLKQLRLELNPALRSANVQLYPADLGRVSIRIRVDEGRVHASVRAESSQTLALLEAHVPELLATFESQGLEAGDLDLGLGFGGESDGQDSDSGAPAGEPSELQTQYTPLDTDRLARAIVERGGLDTYA